MTGKILMTAALILMGCTEPRRDVVFSAEAPEVGDGETVDGKATDQPDPPDDEGDAFYSYSDTPTTTVGPTKVESLGSIACVDLGKIVLKPGQGLTSGNGQFVLIMQPDGSLVVYDINGKAIWYKNGNPAGSYFVIEVGSLTLYAPDGRIIWQYRDPKVTAKTCLHLTDEGTLIFAVGGTFLWTNEPTTSGVCPGIAYSDANATNTQSALLRAISQSSACIEKARTACRPPRTFSSDPLVTPAWDDGLVINMEKIVASTGSCTWKQISDTRNPLVLQKWVFRCAPKWTCTNPNP